MRSKRIATIIPSMTTEVAIEIRRFKVFAACFTIFAVRLVVGATIRVLVNWVLRTTACSFLRAS